MATNWTPDLIRLSDQAWSRLWQRFDAMSNDEYLWEPAAGCLSITQRPDGTWTDDFVLPQPQPAPFTTIAWRMWHLIDMCGDNRAAEFHGIEPRGQAIGVDDPDGAPPSTASIPSSTRRPSNGSDSSIAGRRLRGSRAGLLSDRHTMASRTARRVPERRPRTVGDRA